MPDSIRIKVDLGKVPVLLNKGVEKAIKKAVARSIDRTLTGTFTQIVKIIRARKLVDSKAINTAQLKKDFLRTTKKIDQSRSVAEMYGMLEISDIHPSLRAFFAERVPVYVGRGGRTSGSTRKLYGVRVMVMGKKIDLGRAFWPASASREWPIFKRVSKERKPIKKLYGPSFGYMLQAIGVVDEINTYARDRFEREFETNLAYYLEKERG